MKAPSNNEYERKLNKVNVNRLTRCAANMPKPPDHLSLGQITQHAIIVGFHILEEEAEEQRQNANPPAKAQKPEILETKLGSMSPNPFVRARIQILNKMDAFHRNEIERMEKANDTENRIYNEFAHNVRVLGEQFEKKQYGS